MNRLPRETHENGFFHVMVQGINKEYIFEDKLDKEYYLSLLMEYKNKFKLMLLAYCIMDNHAHMLIYTDKVYEMSNYMRIVNSKFAIAYNKAKSRVGYVFRDRFKSQYINDQDYLLKCLNYIHMNPVKANMVNKPDEYTYSSYNNYINKTKIVTDKSIKKIFGTTKNYLQIFLNISNDDFEVMDVDRENKNFEIATSLYFSKENIEIEDLKNNMQKLATFCQEIIIHKKYKQKQVSELLHISEWKLSRILNNNANYNQLQEKGPSKKLQE